MPIRHGPRTTALTSATNFSYHNQNFTYPTSTEMIERKNRALSNSSDNVKSDLKAAYQEHLRSMQPAREPSREELPQYVESQRATQFDLHVSPVMNEQQIQSSNNNVLQNNSNSFKVSDSSMNSIYQRIQNLRQTLAAPNPNCESFDNRES